MVSGERIDSRVVGLTIALVGLHDLGVIFLIASAVIGRGAGGRLIAFLRGVPPVRQHVPREYEENADDSDAYGLNATKSKVEVVVRYPGRRECNMTDKQLQASRWGNKYDGQAADVG